MSTPLDQHVASRTGRVRAARLFSNVVSPPVMFAVLGLAVALHELPFWEGLAWAAVYGFFVSLAPILFVLYLLRTGRIRELHMSNTRERHLPYLMAIGFAALTFGLIIWLGGPELMACLTIFNAVELVILMLINVYWLISFHATAVMAAFVLVGLIFGWSASIVIVLPFVIAVCVVRLYLKRHTPAQVGAGLALGVVSVLSLTLIGCFGG